MVAVARGEVGSGLGDTDDGLALVGEFAHGEAVVEEAFNVASNHGWGRVSKGSSREPIGGIWRKEGGGGFSKGGMGEDEGEKEQSRSRTLRRQNNPCMHACKHSLSSGLLNHSLERRGTAGSMPSVGSVYPEGAVNDLGSRRASSRCSSAARPLFCARPHVQPSQALDAMAAGFVDGEEGVGEVG